MNTQKGFAPILLILLAVIVVGGGVYFYTQNNSIKNDTKNEIVAVVEDTSTTDDTKTKKDQPDTPLITNDVYQNGTYPGIIKAAYLNNEGKMFIDVDFYQIVTGKQAFLEIAKNLYYSEENKNKNWDEFKTKYPTYLELEKVVQPMSEEEFDDMFAEWAWVERGDNTVAEVTNSIIGGNFSKITTYEKNESTKIRTLPLDKNTIISIYTKSEFGQLLGPYGIDQSQFMKEFNLYGDNLYNGYHFEISITDGIVKKIDSNI